MPDNLGFGYVVLQVVQGEAAAKRKVRYDKLDRGVDKPP
jgi:hypothetical protein